jgi:cytochrome c553
MISSQRMLLSIGACVLVLLAQSCARTRASEPSSSETPSTSWDESVERAAIVSRLSGRVDEGRAIFATCAECHLESGAGQPDGTMPQLAGQHRSVLIKQLTDIRLGIRKNHSMKPFAKQVDGPQAVADVASYIETLPVRSDNGKGPGVDLELGQEIYRRDCARCHGEKGEGDAAAFYPKLEGQHYHYLVRQIIDFAGGRRDNAHADMIEASVGLSADEVSVVADYVSRLPVAQSVRSFE